MPLCWKGALIHMSGKVTSSVRFPGVAALHCHPSQFVFCVVLMSVFDEELYNDHLCLKENAGLKDNSKLVVPS